MRHTSALAVVGLVSCMTLGACSDNEPTATPPASPTPSASSSSPVTQTPTQPPQSSETEPVNEGEPKLPELAKEHSQAGAKAFIEHYIKALNYAFRTNNAAPLRPISAESCGVCAELMAAVERSKKNGGRQIGGLWHPSDLSFVPTQPAKEPIALVTIRVHEGSYRSARDEPAQPIEPHRITQEYRVSLTDGEWQLEDVSTV